MRACFIYPPQADLVQPALAADEGAPTVCEEAKPPDAPSRLKRSSLGGSTDTVLADT